MDPRARKNEETEGGGRHLTVALHAERLELFSERFDIVYDGSRPAVFDREQQRFLWNLVEIQGLSPAAAAKMHTEWTGKYGSFFSSLMVIAILEKIKRMSATAPVGSPEEEHWRYVKRAKDDVKSLRPPGRKGKSHVGTIIRERPTSLQPSASDADAALSQRGNRDSPQPQNLQGPSYQPRHVQQSQPSAYASLPPPMQLPGGHSNMAQPAASLQEPSLSSGNLQYPEEARNWLPPGSGYLDTAPPIQSSGMPRKPSPDLDYSDGPEPYVPERRQRHPSRHSEESELQILASRPRQTSRQRGTPRSGRSDSPVREQSPGTRLENARQRTPLPPRRSPLRLPNIPDDLEPEEKARRRAIEEEIFNIWQEALGDDPMGVLLEGGLRNQILADAQRRVDIIRADNLRLIKEYEARQRRKRELSAGYQSQSYERERSTSSRREPESRERDPRRTTGGGRHEQSGGGRERRTTEGRTRERSGERYRSERPEPKKSSGRRSRR